MSFDYLPPAEAFLDPDRADSRHPESAKAVVIPFGLEASVSYGGGTARGPEAILAASHQLELYDEELQREAVNDYGIATLVPEAIAAGQEAALRQLAGTVERVLDADRFPFVIGGEHALTPGAIMPLAAAYHDLVVLQFDAHADLRDGYLGEHYSHASAMRRVLDHKHVQVVSVGIRALSSPEAEYARGHPDRVTIHWAKDQADWNIERIVAPLVGKPVYITYDIDALDSAIMPATGTPTPGGMGYLQSLRILRRASEVAGRIVGADLVELAPQPGLHACDYTAAVLAYKMMSYALSGTRPRA
jgi:agmatinase